MPDTLPVHKAARLAALVMLDDLGLLAGVSDIELGQILGIDRATAWRDRQDLETVRKLRTEYLCRLILAKKE